MSFSLALVPLRIKTDPANFSSIASVSPNANASVERQTRNELLNKFYTVKDGSQEPNCNESSLEVLH